MRLELIDGIRVIIIALLAYIPTVTISGWFTAWVAKRCDDDLPERLGFLTLDPFAHFSFFGFAMLLISELFGNYLSFHIPGFGRFIILDPQPTNRKIKVVLEFFARSLAHFVMFTIALLALFALFKSTWFLPSSVFPEGKSALLLSCKDILLYFYSQNLALCGIYFLFGIADTICVFSNIPRMFSARYFVVLIATLLILGTLVERLFGTYVQIFHHVFVGLYHG